MSLDTVADAVREMLSTEQWTIVRCATLISKGGTDEHLCPWTSWWGGACRI